MPVFSHVPSLLRKLGSAYRIIAFLLLSLLPLSFTDSPLPPDAYPQGYFGSPVGHTWRLTGNFGELRNNHFHAGLDIPPAIGSAGGDAIYAAADGFVSRLFVSPVSYGNAVFLEHENGFTTLYGHLSGFEPALQAFVRERQYASQSFEQDLRLDTDLFPVKKGQVIGYMGNTGGSMGAHLHFEIRETATQAPINPLLFGYSVPDSQAPQMNKLKVYGYNEAQELVYQEVFTLVKDRANNAYTVANLPRGGIELSAAYVGFALSVDDYFDDRTSRNGIYTAELQADGIPYCAYSMEKIAFEDTRYMNAHVDYAEKIENGRWFHRLFRLPGSKLPIYSALENDGLLALKADAWQSIALYAGDVAGNKSVVSFQVKRGGDTWQPVSHVFNYILLHNEPNRIEAGDLALDFPEGAFYEKLLFYYQPAYEAGSHIYSAMHFLHRASTPVHDYFSVKIKPQNLPIELRDKAFVAACSGGNVTNAGAVWEGEYLVGKARSFSGFCVMTDTQAPIITPLGGLTKGKNIGTAKSISFRIHDGLSGIKKYECYLNGEWALLEYDGKSSTIAHHFRPETPRGQLELLLTVTDACNNAAVYEITLTR